MALLATTQPSLAIAPDLGLDTTYRFVGECGGGSGTAIARRVMITAKHVPGIWFEVQGRMYTAVQRFNHPSHDIAVFIFGEDLPGWYQLGASAPVGAPVTWVGYGGIGTVNNQWQGYDIRYGNHGRHAATNVVHKKWSLFGLGPALVSMLADQPNSASVNGDSGGAVFSNGRLVGVISYAFNETGGSRPNYGFAANNGGVPYHGSGAIDLTVPEIRQWVLQFVRPLVIARPQSLIPFQSPTTVPWKKPLALPFFQLRRG